MTEEVRDAASGERPDPPIDDATGDDNDTTAPESDASAREPSAAATPEQAAAAAEPGATPAASNAGPEAGIDYKDKWLRSEAELQNFRRRAQRDREDSIQRAQENVLLDVIGLLDDLDRALAAVKAEQSAEPWAQGVALTAQRMRDTLARWDVSEIEAAGRPFDPAVHEAMLEIDAPEGVAPGSVAQVIQKGYRRGERPLRPARVVVARLEQGGA